MNIIFIGTCGVYHPLIAANMHLNRLKTEDYRKLTFFANHEMEKSGKPLSLGTDSLENRIYTLGVGPDVDMVKKSIQDLRHILGASEDELQVIPIIIKPQLLLLILHKLSAPRLLRYFLLPWITYLIKKQLPAIKQQLNMALGDG